MTRFIGSIVPPNSSSQVQLMCIYCCYCPPSPFNRLSICGWCRLARARAKGEDPSCFPALGALWLSIVTRATSYPSFSYLFPSFSRQLSRFVFLSCIVISGFFSPERFRMISQIGPFFFLSLSPAFCQKQAKPKWIELQSN